MSEKIKGSMEKHIQTVMIALVIAVMAWVGSSVSQQKVSIAVLTLEVEQMKEHMKLHPNLTRDEVIVLLSPQKDAIHDLVFQMADTRERVKKIENDLYVKYLNPNKKLND